MADGAALSPLPVPPAAEAPAASGRPLSPLGRALRGFLRNPRSLCALGVIAVMLLSALLAGVLAPHGYGEQLRGSELQPPSGSLLFGTDTFGRCIFSRMLYGARVSLLISVAATALSLVIGTVVGLLSGYLGGWVDAVLMRATDTVSAFPSILLAVAITSLTPRPEIWIIFVALGITGWTSIARVVRAQVLSVRTLDYISAARALGARRLRIMFGHVLPNCLSPMIVIVTLSIGGNILGEAGLSFLGLGVQDPYPSWGGMLSEARNHFQREWWTAVFPGLGIVLTVLAFNLLGDGLRDALDPRKGRGLG